MALSDWTSKYQQRKAAIADTLDTHNRIEEKSVAGVATVAGWTILNTAHPELRPTHNVLTGLFALYPSVVEGCKLSDILTFADVEDYDDLKKPSVMECFARTLRDSVKIMRCEED